MKQLRRSEIILLSATIVTLAALIFFETHPSSINSSELFAQAESRGLILSNDTVADTIFTGAWIAAISKVDSERVILGRLLKVDSLGIQIGLPGKNSILHPFKVYDAYYDLEYTQLGAIYKGEPMRKWHYTKRGIRLGSLVGLGFGIIVGFDCANPLEYPGAFLFATTFGTLVMDLYTIPPSALLGFLTGLIKEKRAVLYPLSGSDSWSIRPL
ncbi:MAG: hypothetical protein GXO90_05385 [FCB group bacterium]|nr:hypothetical protein [FCB group bacterium]